MLDSPITLTQEQIDFYRREGYLVLPPITNADELARLRQIYDRLFAEKAGRAEGNQFDLAGADEEGQEATLPQILGPARYAPELNDFLFKRNAKAIAEQLLGGECTAGDHAILKPPRYGAPTPWHQDEAYWSPDLQYNSLSIWMPLQDVTATNGCMHFIPGSHRGELLAHRCYNHDPHANALECFADIELSNAVACPLLAGGCTIHTGRTLHYASGNGTDAGRWAYILAFYLPPRHRRVQAVPWFDLTRTAKMARRRAWLRRGGFLVHWWRTEFSNRLLRVLGG